MEKYWSLVNLNMTLSVSSSPIDETSRATQSPSTSSSAPCCTCIGYNSHNFQRYESNPFEEADDAEAANTFDRWSTLAMDENTSSSSDSDFQSSAGLTTGGPSVINHRNTGLSGNNWFAAQSIGPSVQHVIRSTWSRGQSPLDTVCHQSGKPIAYVEGHL